MSDIFSGDKLPYMIGVWALGGMCTAIQSYVQTIDDFFLAAVAGPICKYHV